MLLVISVLATACLIAFTGSASAASVTAGDPIEDALVKLVDYPQYNDTTDVNGNYSINNVPYGTYTISASAAGYDTNTSTITVDGAVTKDFILSPGGITGDYRYYSLTDNEISSNKVSTLSDLGTSFTIPQYGDGTAWQTDVFVTDYSGLGAALTLEYYDSDGALLVTENTNIAANATYKWTPTDGTNGRPTSGMLSITSDNNVAGGFMIYSMSNTDMISSKLYTSADAGTSFSIPQYGDGTDWDTWIAISDITGLSANLTIEYYNESGALVLTETPNITANGILTFIPTDGTNGRPTAGKLEITSDYAIVGEYRIFSKGTGGILSNKLYTAKSKGTSFSIPQYGDGTYWTTWIAISADSGIDAGLTIEYYYPNGTLAVTETNTVSGNGILYLTPTDGTNGRPIKGKLNVSSNNTILGEMRIYHTDTRGIMANSLFAQKDASSALIVPYYGNNINYGTYLSMADISGAETPIQMDYHYLDGTLAKTEYKTITADGLIELVVSDGTNGKPTEGNIIIYS